MFASLFAIGPRAAILVWWIISPARWQASFDSFWWAFLGFMLAPWTTLMWVSVAPGGIVGFDWILLGLGVFADIATWGSSAREGNERYVTA